MIVKSGSMEPAIKTGALVAVRPAAGYEAGDIITFRTSDNKKIDSTTHRVVEKQAEDGEISYITKGDANKAPDIRKIP